MEPRTPEATRRYAFSLSRSPQKVLPTALVSGHDGLSYLIDPCYRTVLACLRWLCDPAMEEMRKRLYLARFFFLNHPPRDMDALFAAFVTGGETGGDEPPLMDFEVDAGAIYASFRQQYGIDLLREELHWIEFRELLAGLCEDTPFGARVRLRALPDREISAEDRPRIQKLREMIRIPERVDPAEQALLTELNRRLAEGEDPTEIIRQLQEG